jgi:hypothetical protein
MLSAPWNLLVVVALVTAGCDDSALRPPAERFALAVVDGRAITMADLAVRLRELPPERRPKGEDGLARLLQQLVDEAVLEAEGRHRGFGDSAEARAATAALLADRRLEELVASVGASEVTDEEVERYHAEHLERFSNPEVRRIAAASFAFLEEARRARAGGLDGAEELGEVTATGKADPRVAALPANLVSEVWTLPSVGAVSEPVASRGRFWLVKLTGRIAGEVRGVSRERDNIRRAILDERLRRARDELLASLRGDVTVRIDEAVLADVKADGDLSAYDPAQWKVLRGERR